MVLASDLRPDMAVRVDSEVYRVLEVESKAGAAKMSGVVRAKLENVRSGRQWEQHFRPQERLEDLELQRRRMAFLFNDDRFCTFQRTDTFDQVEVPASLVEDASDFLEPGMEMDVDFFEDEPIHVAIPEVIDCRVKTTAPPARSQQDSGRKEATLENGLSLQVPLFVAPGETVRVDVRTRKYVERVRLEHKRGA